MGHSWTRKIPVFNPIVHKRLTCSLHYLWHYKFFTHYNSGKKSLLSTEYWFDLVFKSGRSDANVFLVGNKLDLEENREVPFELGKKYADDNKAQFFETSALTGLNIRNLFFKSAQDFVKLDDRVLETEIIEQDKEIVKIDSNAVYSNQTAYSLEQARLSEEEKKCCHRTWLMLKFSFKMRDSSIAWNGHRGLSRNLGIGNILFLSWHILLGLFLTFLGGGCERIQGKDDVRSGNSILLRSLSRNSISFQS